VFQRDVAGQGRDTEQLDRKNTINALRIQSMSKRLFLAAAIAALMLAPSIAGAVPIAIGGTQGLEGLGAFSGTFDYTATDDTTGTVNIVLNNDSPTAGWITAFVFNIPAGAVVTGSDLTTSDNDFLPGLFEIDNVNGAPFGQFDIGAASGGGSFEGGGAPQLGIAQFGSATFTFTLTGSGLGSLTSQDFLSTLSTGMGAGEGFEDFVVRFRGFPDNGSDKVPNDGGVVPEPGTLSLLGLGIASLAARRRARAKS
jgi:hypothetical protein